MSDAPISSPSPPVPAARKDGRATAEPDVGRLRDRLSDLEFLRAHAAAEADLTRAEAARSRDQIAALRVALDEARSEAQAATAQLELLRRTLSWRLTLALRRVSDGAPQLSRLLERARRLTNRRKLRVWARVLRQSGLFDASYYLARYPDVARSGMDPLTHYLAHGAMEMRDPNPLFSTRYYWDHNPDVRRAGVNPLFHYATSGADEGRRPGPDFDAAAYASSRPSLAASGANPLAHRLEQLSRESSGEGPAPEESRDVIAKAKTLHGERGGTPRVLFVDFRLPTPDMDSGSVRMFALVQLLLRVGYPVTFVSHVESPQPRYEEALRALGVRVLYGLGATQVHLRREGARYRWIVLSRPLIGQEYMTTARALALFADVVYDTVDLHWLRLERAAALLGDPQIARSAEEHRVVEGFNISSTDLVLAVTDVERRKILAEWPQARVAVVPNVHRCRPRSETWSERSGLVFIGSYEHAPNEDAVRWFATEVLPLVRRQLPEARFTILGSKPTEKLAALAGPSVDVVGYVEDAEPSFGRARVFVAPLRYGAGMKGKVGQAMSLGLPVVTTSVGAEGMLLEDGVHALVADSAAEFASAVVRLYGDETLWNALRGAALAHIEQHFSERAVERILRELFGAPTATDVSAPGVAAHGR